MGLLVVHLEAGRECAAAQGPLAPAHPALGRPAPRLPRRLGARPKLGLRGDHLPLLRLALRVPRRGREPLFVQLCALSHKRRGCRGACDRAGAAGPALHRDSEQPLPAPPRVGFAMPAMHLGVDVGESVEDVVDRVCEGLRRRACRKRQPAGEMRSGTPAAKHRAGHKRGSAPQCAACTDCCRSVNVRERQRGAANMNGGRGGERGTAVFQAALVVHEPLCYFWHPRRPTTRRSRAAELRTSRRRWESSRRAAGGWK